MALTGLDILHSIFTTIAVVISILIGLIIISKYFKLKQRNILLIGIVILPLTVLCGLTAFTSLLGTNKGTRKKILIIVLIFNVIFESLIIYFLFADVPVIATLEGDFNINWSVFSQIYFIINLLIFLITGILFSRESLKSESREIKFKGKLLLIAFVSFTIGTILDFAVAFTVTYIIARLILLSSSIEFYIGFLLPERIKRLLFQG